MRNMRCHLGHVILETASGQPNTERKARVIIGRSWHVQETTKKETSLEGTGKGGVK